MADERNHVKLNRIAAGWYATEDARVPGRNDSLMNSTLKEIKVVTTIQEMIDSNTDPAGEDFWLGQITDVHVAGPFAVVEYEKSQPGNEPYKSAWRPGMLSYSTYYFDAERDVWTRTGHSHNTLEAALIHVVVFVREDRYRGRSAAANSRHTEYIMRMTGPECEEGTN